MSVSTDPTASSDIGSRVHGLSQRPMVQNFFALSAVQAANFLLPLATIPYLTRTLEPFAWGRVCLAQAFAQYMILLIEYGFIYSATRQVAQCRDKPNELADLVAGVMGAKTLLACAALIPTLLLWWLHPVFHEYSKILWVALFYAVLFAFHPLWFFQGIERLRVIATLDVIAKSVTTLGVFLVVRHPRDAWKVLALYALGASISTVVGLIVVYRNVRPRLPSAGLVRDALRMGFTMFVFRSAVSLYAVSNAFILGIFKSTEIVGFYATPEKITRAILQLMTPLTQTFYPRIASLLQQDRAQAASLARKALYLFGFAGVVGGGLVFLLAYPIIHLAMGKHYVANAVPVLQILALTIPMIALSTILGVLWMLPLRLDVPFNAIILSAGLLNVTIALFTAPHYGETGMAWTVVLSEAVVTVAMFVVLRRKRLDPLSFAKVDAHAVIVEPARPPEGTAVPGPGPAAAKSPAAPF
ncbi:MAG: flippase [Planctomycetota bacterium]|nr:flippase [Planctomycetota bacterium]